MSVLLAIMSSGKAIVAHEARDRHSHLSGAIWYQDIVYDGSSPDTVLTSLDIYVPERSARDAPVLVYVHGGGFGRGDKADAAELFPKRRFFTNELGYLFVSVNYRLLPEARYPTNTQDVANAVAWVHDHIADYGGNPERLVLMGWDVGGVMAAQVATDESFLRGAGKELSVLNGVIPIEAAGYDLTERSPEGLQGFFGPDPDTWVQASSITHVASGKRIPPFLMLHAEDGSMMGGVNSRAQAEQMAQALERAGVPVETVPLPDQDHDGSTESIGVPGAVGTAAVTAFLEMFNGG